MNEQFDEKDYLNYVEFIEEKNIPKNRNRGRSNNRRQISSDES